MKKTKFLSKKYSAEEVICNDISVQMFNNFYNCWDDIREGTKALP